MRNPTITFLRKNNFKKKPGVNSYSNGLCTVKLEETYYVVSDKNGTVYSDDLNIYWLIGILTYYNFIDKNYNSLITSVGFL